MATVFRTIKTCAFNWLTATLIVRNTADVHAHECEGSNLVAKSRWVIRRFRQHNTVLLVQDENICARIILRYCHRSILLSCGVSDSL